MVIVTPDEVLLWKDNKPKQLKKKKSGLGGATACCMVGEYLWLARQGTDGIDRINPKTWKDSRRVSHPSVFRISFMVAHQQSVWIGYDRWISIHNANTGEKVGDSLESQATLLFALPLVDRDAVWMASSDWYLRLWQPTDATATKYQPVETIHVGFPVHSGLFSASQLFLCGASRVIQVWDTSSTMKRVVREFSVPEDQPSPLYCTEGNGDHLWIVTEASVCKAHFGPALTRDTKQLSYSSEPGSSSSELSSSLAPKSGKKHDRHTSSSPSKSSKSRKSDKSGSTITSQRRKQKKSPKIRSFSDQ